MRWSRRVALGAGLTLALGLGAASFAQDAPNTETKVQEILTRMDRGGMATLWDRCVDLENLGEDAAPVLAKRLEGSSPTIKLGIAKALLAMEGAEGQRPAAIGAVKDVLSGDGSRDVKVAAADILTIYGQRDEVKALERQLDGITDPYVKLAVLKALKKKGRVRPAIDQMKKFLESDDFSVKAEAALRLAECEEFDASKVVLNQLKVEPSERGRRARALLDQAALLQAEEKRGGVATDKELVKLREKQIEDLKEKLDEAQKELAKGGGAARGGKGSALIRELEDKISKYYVDEKKSSIPALTEAAAKGMADALDPFSQYMSEKENSSFREQMSQEYAGIGAVVQTDRKSGLLTIVRPIYGGPAYKAGLRTLDQILEVEGESTKGQLVSNLVTKLKGKRGTKVNIKVKKFLAGPTAEPTMMAVTRDFIMLPSVRFGILPGKVGYVQLEHFGAKAADEIEAALTELEKVGMKALVFDLRGNPGGYLNQAVEVASKFLAKGKLVCYQQGRAGAELGARRDFVVSGDETHPDYPLVVLVDENSASASEIVSGCLQVHKRADLVGQQTFGKGSVQQIFPVESTEGKSALRLTIAYYYLPDGRCIHRPRSVKAWKFRETIRSEIERWKQEGEISDAQAKILLDQYKLAPGGVVPDFSVEAERFAPDVQKKMATLLETGKLEEYVQKNWATNQKVFHELAGWDSFDAAKYPGFDAFYTDCKTELSKDDLRKLLRMEVRRFAQDDFARILPSDFQEDTQLQAAVLVASQKIGVDVNAVAELSFIGKKFPKGLERNPAPVAGKKGPPDSADEDEDETGAPKPEKKDEKKPEKKDEPKQEEPKKPEKKEDF